ncbi:hypothetical protein ISS42_00640 [Candidatus Shapirobacteria bacterium]|nr:hypothetical protein [Candidatus Shapirobacteria bacterium]
MKIPITSQERLKFWKAKLKKYQEQYRELKKQSPDRWHHDEHFDNQLKVLENSIVTAKERVLKLKEKVKK